MHETFQSRYSLHWQTAPFDEVPASPNQLRWNPLPMPAERVDFVDGITSMAGNGDVRSGYGFGVHIYRATAPMRSRYFSCSDGELLIVPNWEPCAFLPSLDGSMLNRQRLC